jgi:hypothetical protein
LRLELVAGERDLLGVDDDDEVADVEERRVDGLRLAREVRATTVARRPSTLPSASTTTQRLAFSEIFGSGVRVLKESEPLRSTLLGRAPVGALRDCGIVSERPIHSNVSRGNYDSTRPSCQARRIPRLLRSPRPQATILERNDNRFRRKDAWTLEGSSTGRRVAAEMRRESLRTSSRSENTGWCRD